MEIWKRIVRAILGAIVLLTVISDLERVYGWRFYTVIALASIGSYLVIHRGDIASWRPPGNTERAPHNATPVPGSERGR